MNPHNASGKFPDVIGYISEPERIALQRGVLRTSHIKGDALEIGSLNGLSALLILSVLESHKQLVCIEKGSTEALKTNLMTACTLESLEKIVIWNNDFNDIEETRDYSFIFIDHDHSYDNTMKAFHKFWPMLSVGGIMAFHDYGHPDYSEGTQAVLELFRDSSKYRKSVSITGGLMSFLKK